MKQTLKEQITKILNKKGNSISQFKDGGGNLLVDFTKKDITLEEKVDQILSLLKEEKKRWAEEIEKRRQVFIDFILKN